MQNHAFNRRSLLLKTSAFGLALRRIDPTQAATPAFPLVVDLDWLATAAKEPNLRIFDVSPLHIWRSGHIDSAQHAWWRDTVDPNYPVFGAVLTQGDDQKYRQRVIDSLAIGVDDRVVVYDNAHGFRAARLVWFLRFLGFHQTALLDASFADWKHNPFSIESISAAHTNPTVDPQQGYYLVTQQLLELLSSPDLQLIDIRTDEERTTDLGGAIPTGQIPGSIRMPWNTLLDSTGHLLAPKQLDTRLITLKRPTVLYGRFGVDTSLSWLALRNMGMTDIQTYDRGWAEWSITPDLPRESIG